MPVSPLHELLADKRAVIFDLFHTLTALEAIAGDTRPLTHVMLGLERRAWDQQLLERSRERLIGRKTDPYVIIRDMARAIDPTLPEDLIRRATENRMGRFATALQHMPMEAQHAVRALKSAGKRIGLISNADVMEMAAWSECPIRNQFDSTLFSCEVGCAKPEPEIYHRSLRELGVTPAEAVFVGDGGSGELQAARNVGITAVMFAGIVRKYSPERVPERVRQADFVIEDLAELLPFPPVPTLLRAALAADTRRAEAANPGRA
jgi:putative hydrolase of the HAD superfamily